MITIHPAEEITLQQHCANQVNIFYEQIFQMIIIHPVEEITLQHKSRVNIFNDVIIFTNQYLKFTFSIMDVREIDVYPWVLPAI